MYFDNFPVIRYGSTDGTIKNVDLLRRVAVRSKVKTNSLYLIPMMSKMERHQRLSQINYMMTQSYIG